MSSEPETETLKFKRKPTKRRLTKRTVEALTPPPEVDGKPTQQWTYDATTPRLAICAWSSGSKVWYWVGRGPDGRMLRFKLGSFPETPPELARKLAAKVSADIAHGIDPRHERWKARKELTLAELLEKYLEHHAKPHKKTWEDDQKQFNRYCSSLKSRSISTITRYEFSQLHLKVGEEHGKYSANRLLALLSKMYSFAATLGWPGANPVKGIKRFREESRDRFLNADELARFFKALSEEPPLFQDYFTLLLLTGARRSNVEAMRFEQLDLEIRSWRMPVTKNGKPLTIPLVGEALAILKRRLAESNGNPWVFPGGRKNPTGHLNSPKGAWARILERSGLKDVRPHDLRRTLGSWQAATGASLPIIGKSLGHSNQSTTQIYARLNLDPVRQAVDTAVNAMLAAANGAKKDKEGSE